MPVCDGNEQEAPSFYALLGFTMAALIEIGRKRILMHRSQNHTVLGEVCTEQDQNSMVAESEYGSQDDTHYFPWEPLIHNKDKNNTNEDKESSYSDHIRGKEEDFLSVMTFANQNLRQPSCLCCR